MSMPPATNTMVVSLEMGYGHLRAAHSLANALGTEVTLADEAPLADEFERKLWQWIRRAHGLLSRPTPWAFFERPANAMMDLVTMIPSLYDAADQSRPDVAVLALHRLIRLGLGKGLVRALREQRSTLVTTFYAPAIIADEAGVGPIYCVVTDADVHRVWVPIDAERSNIHYLAPSPRVVRRLQAYGVRADKISLTGFPLPGELSEVGDTGANPIAAQVARRIVRLDPDNAFCALHAPMLERVLGKLPEEQRGLPVEIVFAVGGAGAQVGLSDTFLPRLRDHILRNRVRIHLVAGTRAEVAQRFTQQLRRARLTSRLGSGVSILYAPDFASYYRKFNQLLAQADVLWTKPSELSFYAGLGIPLVLSHPVGAHERFNRRWLREHGAGLKQRRLDQFPGWLDEWLLDGNLAAAAWSAYTRIPRTGTEQIVQLLRGSQALETSHSTAGGDFLTAVPASRTATAISHA
jgi:hypothetical protein